MNIRIAQRFTIMILIAANPLACDRTEPVPPKAAPLAAVVPADTSATGLATAVTVFKSPTCGCCKHWVTHLEANGFTVTSEDRNDMDAIKTSYGVPEEMHSCHTAIVGDYVIEGHVPASDIRKLLQERPAITGLSAPGMPQKSPGMQPPGLPPREYDVISFTSEGATQVFTSYQ